MKIIKLTAQNIKKLRAIEITPDLKEALVKITGKNGQGKTSVLDSILWALAGGRKIPDMPIRKGSKKGKITMDLGELIIERTFTQKGSYLKVLTKEGAEYPKAQEKLSELVQGISFDPAEFMRLGDKERLEIIKEITGQGEEFEKIEADYIEAYEERKFANRNLKEKKTVFEQYGEIEKVERIDVVALSNELNEFAEKKRTIDDYALKIQHTEKAIEDLTRRIAEFTIILEEESGDLRKYKKIHDDAKAGFDLEAAQAKKKQLEDAREINEQAQRYEEFERTKSECEKAAREFQYASEKVQVIANRKAELLQGAKMPIDKLEVEDGKIFIDGLPFEQLSTSEQIRISFSVAMAINPKLKVIRITDGSLLDADALGIIESMAKEKDYQVWIEIVDDTGELGFCIEDGHIKGEEVIEDEEAEEGDSEEAEEVEEAKVGVGGINL